MNLLHFYCEIVNESGAPTRRRAHAGGYSRLYLRAHRNCARRSKNDARVSVRRATNRVRLIAAAGSARRKHLSSFFFTPPSHVKTLTFALTLSLSLARLVATFRSAAAAASSERFTTRCGARLLLNKSILGSTALRSVTESGCV